MAMSPAMLAALQSKNPTLVHLVEMEFPDRTIRLCDGAGYVSWGAKVFLGSDPDIGVIAGFGEFTETEGTESPRQQISFMVKDNAALVKLTSPISQGTPVTIYAAVIEPATGLIIGVPDVRFTGEIDDAEIGFGKNQRLVTLELSSAWELLFDNNEGARWNDTFWTYLYGDGARAFYAVTNVQRKMFWGYEGPQVGAGGGFVTGGGGYIGGSGGGFPDGGFGMNYVI